MSRDQDAVAMKSGLPARSSPERGTVERRSRPIDAAGLAILVLSVAVGLALVLLATATFIQVVRG